jgi:hypothetical protein
MTIRLSPDSLKWDCARMTPGSKGEWGNCRFIVGVEKCDWWVVYEKLEKKEKAIVPKGNIILIAGEPPSIKNYEPRFLKQFSLMITCQRDIKHPNVLHMQQALPWRVGVRFKGTMSVGFSKNYDELKAMTLASFKKEKTISVISSNLTTTEGHRKRLAFVKALQAHFGNRIDVFGRGLKEIEDKWDAIAPYKYHVALENSSYPDYWTEKLSDAYLGGAYPFYYGCPNLEDYFPKGSFSRIDVDNVEESIATIEKAIETGKYEKAVGDVMAARDLVLDKFNLFSILADVCEKQVARGQKKRVVIRPQASFGNFRRWLGRMLGRG